MLLAETAYNIFLALPDGEKERLYAMMEKQRQPKLIKLTKKSNVWTIEQCMEVVLPLMKQRRDNRINATNHKLKVVK